jgi:hypothetical protein
MTAPKVDAAYLAGKFSMLNTDLPSRGFEYFVDCVSERPEDLQSFCERNACSAGLGEAKVLIKSIITKENMVPSFLRLAIHDAFCFDAQNNVYGANASIRCQILPLATINHQPYQGAVQVIDSNSAFFPKH